jgi:hypothetical protein
MIRLFHPHAKAAVVDWPVMKSMEAAFLPSLHSPRFALDGQATKMCKGLRHFRKNYYAILYTGNAS